MYTVILFTNRTLIVWDEAGHQHDLQLAADCYEINQPILDQLLASEAEYYIARWGKWKHQITQREFEYLLGQRTREKDIADKAKERNMAS